MLQAHLQVAPLAQLVRSGASQPGKGAFPQPRIHRTWEGPRPGLTRGWTTDNNPIRTPNSEQK